MQYLQKDLNLFTAYKSSSAKSGGSGSIKGPLVLILCFILAVGGGYGALFFFQYNAQQQINSVKNDLTAPAIVEAQAKLADAAQLNDFMIQYQSALLAAKKNFDASRILDADMIQALADAMPADVTMISLTINPSNINMSCTCTDPLSPVAFIQELNRGDLFKDITTTGITSDENAAYTFTLVCNFKEVTVQ